MNMNENSMDYVHLMNEKLLGSYQWKGKIDLLNIVLIGIANKLPEHDNKYELHRLLSTLLSMELPVTKRLEIMETEYNILIDDKMREDVDSMCNLSQGILEKGEAKIILAMYKNGYTVEQIASATDKDVEEIKAIVEKGRIVSM